MTTDPTGTNGTRDAVMPGTVADLVTRIRAIQCLVQDLRELAEWGIEALDRGHRHRAATGINGLPHLGAHLPGHPLERIAAGLGTSDDYEWITTRLCDAAGTVEECVNHLERYRDTLHGECGPGAANTLTNVIRGGGGNMTLRLALELLVEESRNGQHPPGALQRQAQSIVRFIDLLNTNLAELLELIVRHARGRG